MEEFVVANRVAGLLGERQAEVDRAVGRIRPRRQFQEGGRRFLGVEQSFSPFAQLRVRAAGHLEIGRALFGRQRQRGFNDLLFTPAQVVY